MQTKCNFFLTGQVFKASMQNAICLVWQQAPTHTVRCQADLFQVALIFWSPSFETFLNCAKWSPVRAKHIFFKKCIENTMKNELSGWGMLHDFGHQRKNWAPVRVKHNFFSPRNFEKAPAGSAMYLDRLPPKILGSESSVSPTRNDTFSQKH